MSALGYVVRCGVGLFLGEGEKARAGTIERAARFATLEVAEARVAELRGQGGVYVLPWRAEAVAPQESEARG